MLECLNLNLEEFNYLENYITKFSDNKIYSTFYLNQDKLSNNGDFFINEIFLKHIIFINNNKLKIAIMFKFNESTPQILGRVYDYDKSSDKEHLEMLLFQSEIPICFTKSCKQCSSFFIENEFKEAIKEYIINKNKLYKYKVLNLEIKELWYNS